jgi:hypothetical protein
MNGMNEEKNADEKVKTGEYYAPWEKSFDKILTPFEASHQPGKSIITNDALRAVVQTLGNGVHSVEAPLQRLELPGNTDLRPGQRRHPIGI